MVIAITAVALAIAVIRLFVGRLQVATIPGIAPISAIVRLAVILPVVAIAIVVAIRTVTVIVAIAVTAAGDADVIIVAVPRCDLRFVGPAAHGGATIVSGLVGSGHDISFRASRS